jgi:hypothetical protein
MIPSRVHVSSLVLLAFPAACIFAALPAHANAAMKALPAVHDQGAVVLEPTTLSVVDEELSFTCGNGDANAIGGSAVECAFTARYTLVNDREETLAGVGVFYGFEASDVVILLNGSDASTAPTADVLHAIDEAVRGADPTARFEDVSRTGFRVEVAARAQAPLEVSGVITEWSRAPTSINGITDASFARHRYVSERPRDERTARFRYLVSPIRTWASAPSAIRVVVDVDDGLIVGNGARRSGDHWQTDSDPAATSVLTFDVVQPARNFLVGGPFAGAGIDMSAAVSVRLRAGWEIAYPPAILYAVALETTGTRELALVPSAEAALPECFIVPAFGVGVGVPLRTSLDARGHVGVDVGVRGQLSASLSILELLVPVDYYVARSDPSRVAAIAQLTF